MIEAIYKAHEINQTDHCVHRSIWLQRSEKRRHAYTSCAVPEEMFAAMREIVTPAEMEEAVFTDVEAGSRGKYPCHYRKTGRGICRE